MIFRLLPESRLDRVAIDQAIDIRVNNGKQFKLETALIERNRLVNSLLIQLRFF